MWPHRPVPPAPSVNLAALQAAEAAQARGGDVSYLPDICRAAGLPVPLMEYRFAPPRRWRFDYCWPEQFVAVEVEGGVFAGGRHTRGAGYRADLQKYNTATLMGYRVLRYLPEQLTASLDDLRALLCR